HSLARITPLPTPLAVRLPDSPWVEASPPPASRVSRDGGTYLFYRLAPSQVDGVLRVDYGVPSSSVWTLFGSALAWVVLPFLIPFTIREALSRQGRQSPGLFTGLSWAGSLLILGIVVAWTLPGT